MRGGAGFGCGALLLSSCMIPTSRARAPRAHANSERVKISAHMCVCPCRAVSSLRKPTSWRRSGPACILATQHTCQPVSTAATSQPQHKCPDMPCVLLAGGMPTGRSIQPLREQHNAAAGRLALPLLRLVCAGRPVQTDCFCFRRASPASAASICRSISGA